MDFWTEKKNRPYRLIFFFVVLVLVSELGVRLYFTQSNLIDRNPGNTTAAMHYLLEQFSHATRPRIVFCGSSVTQGYGNCPDGKHFPALVAEKLRKIRAYRKASAYNLSSAGNRYGDHFANLVAVMPDEPDLVVTAIHIKMFSVHRSLIEPMSHPEGIYHFRNYPEYWKGGQNDLFARFRMTDQKYREIYLDHKVAALSGLYRYRRLLGYFTTGNFRYPAAASADRIMAWLGMMDPIMVEAADTTFVERNADYLWKVIPKHVIALQYMHCEAFDFSEENVNWLTFKNYCEFGQRHGIRMLFFLNPVNKAFVDDKEFFDWDEVMPIFRQRTKALVRSYGHRFVDMTERVDYRFYSDLDHLNMNGHEQTARLILPHVKAALRSKKK